MALTILTTFVIVFTTTIGCQGFYPDFEKYFNFSKVETRVPDDPDVFRNVSELIRSKGYPVEEHYTVTEDGFILSLQRIPHGRTDRKTAKNKPVVLLQHGLLADAGSWVINFPNDTLAYILADHGFDVWLSNSRGNRYSRRNKHFEPWNPEFWKWSFDAMAKYDLPANIVYILNETRQERLVYIGHSQGTLIAFTGFSVQPELAKKVKLFIALAPITAIGNITVASLRDLAEIVTTLDTFAPIIDSAFLPGNLWRKQFIEKGFCDGITQEKFCYRIVEYIFGTDEKNINLTRVPVALNSFPSGTSFRNMVHFAQLVTSGKCRKFDYGLVGNYLHYNQSRPPPYPIEDIDIPIAMFSGTHDTLSDPKDVAALAPRIKNLVINKVIQDWNHVDFLYGEDANVLLYPEIVKLIEKYMAI